MHDIYLAFRDHAVPPKRPKSLADILNAGWQAFNDGELWRDRPDIPCKDEALHDLVFKTIEVLEVNQRIHGG